MVWAFHSESQDLLLDEATKAAGGKLTWEKARTLGLALWIQSNDTLVRSVSRAFALPLTLFLSGSNNGDYRSN